MRILFDIAHPAHVHLIKNTYWELNNKGHKVYVTVRELPVAFKLLNAFNIEYKVLGKKRTSFIGKTWMHLIYNFKILFFVFKYRIDVGFGTSVTLAQMSKLTRMKSIILDDDDDDVEPLFVKYAHPFADVILSPDVISRKTKNLISYPGTHELAYLHPNKFKPDSNILNELGVKPDEKFFVLRFNAFKAHHDVGEYGLNLENKRQLISLLKNFGKIFITTENEIDEEFSQYQLKLAPEEIHHLLYFATMFIGDSQTMTSEAAVLGTPAVKCNTFAGRLSVPNDYEKYGLCYSYLPTDFNTFVLKINELLIIDDIKSVWKQKLEIYLKNKIDSTDFYVEFIEKIIQ